jgi:hypothetical protein
MERETLETVCLCGKQFVLRSALSNHQRSCQRGKKRLSSALTKAKDMWVSKKRKRMEESEIGRDQGSSSGENTTEVGDALVEVRLQNHQVHSPY